MEINIEEYYTRYGPMVMRRCRQLLRDEEKALDAMQEVFTKLMISKKRLRGIYPSSLLFRISTNVCLNMIRDQRSHRSIDIGSEDLLIQLASYDKRENRLIIRDLLGELPSTQMEEIKPAPETSFRSLTYRLERPME
jgi:RNA polymerase sigma-70 factor (ECF subfamily)